MIIESTAAGGEQVAQLVAATRQALIDTDDPGGVSAADPLPIAVTVLRDAYSRAMSYELAAQFVSATFAALNETDKNVTIRALLQ